MDKDLGIPRIDVARARLNVFARAIVMRMLTCSATERGFAFPIRPCCSRASMSALSIHDPAIVPPSARPFQKPIVCFSHEILLSGITFPVEITPRSYWFEVLNITSALTWTK
jgi:hypothetical protein